MSSTPSTNAAIQGPTIKTNGPDRERFHADGESVSIPRVTAVAWHGFEEATSKDVFFENGLPWDLREENMVLAKTPRDFKLKIGDREPTPEEFPERDDYDPKAHFREYQGDSFQYDDRKGERYTSPDGKSIYIHRLAAVAWFGFDAITDSRVFHANGVKWDTREANLSVGEDPELGEDPYVINGKGKTSNPATQFDSKP